MTAVPENAPAAGQAARGDLTPGERDQVLADLGEMLEVLGLGDYARPETPHEVFRQCVAKARDLRREIGDARAEVARASRECTAAARLVVEAGAQRDQARAELAQLRDRCEHLLDLFGRSHDGYRARLSGVVLMREYRDAGLAVPARLAHLEPVSPALGPAPASASPDAAATRDGGQPLPEWERDFPERKAAGEDSARDWPDRGAAENAL